MRQKGFAPIILIITIAIVVLGVIYYLGKQTRQTNNNPDNSILPGKSPNAESCDYNKGDYASKDCSEQVNTLYKAGLPQGSEVKVTAGRMLSRISNSGMENYRIYNTNATIPLENGLTWIAHVEDDSEFMYNLKDKRLILRNMLGDYAANPDYAISNESFQVLISSVLRDYKGKGPMTIVISGQDFTMHISAPDGYSKIVRLDLVPGTGEIKQIPE